MSVIDMNFYAGAGAGPLSAKGAIGGVDVSIVGASGAVGRELVAILAERDFPLRELRLFASSRSAGSEIETSLGTRRVEVFDMDALKPSSIVFLAVSGGFSTEFSPKLAAQGKVVIDNSSAFRYDDDIPLVVPEVNGSALAALSEGDANSLRGIVANPNCTTAILSVALAPLHEAFGLKRVILSTYQAASGAGAAGMDELADQARAVLEGREPTADVFSYPLAFNVIPHIDPFLENGYSREEMKVVWESRKILGLPDLALSCTAVRVPAIRAHCESVTLETERPVDLARARSLLADAPGVRLLDDQGRNIYPMPRTASGRDAVDVGRLRLNPVFGENGLDFFLCGDQLRKGAALNAVQIAECLLARAGASAVAV